MSEKKNFKDMPKVFDIYKHIDEGIEISKIIHNKLKKYYEDKNLDSIILEKDVIELFKDYYNMNKVIIDTAKTHNDLIGRLCKMMDNTSQVHYFLNEKLKLK